MFLKIGHRGARAYETENTIQSFKRAIDLGANAIEFDLQRTSDGQLIVSHDDNLKRVFGQNKIIDNTPLEELKALTSDQIPTFMEALEFIDHKVEKILVEIKKIGYEAEIIARVENSGLHDRIIIVSFHEASLAEIRKLDGRIEAGFIYTRYKNPVAAAAKLEAQYLLPLYSFTHTKNIEEAHKNGLKVLVWTVNSKEEADKYKSKGVDGIASDKPDIL